MKTTDTVIRKLRALCAQHYVEFNRKGFLHGLRITLGVEYHGGTRLVNLVEGTDIAIRQAGAKGKFIAVMPLEILLEALRVSEPFQPKPVSEVQPIQNKIKEQL
jgi:hypothetical protein